VRKFTAESAEPAEKDFRNMQKISCSRRPAVKEKIVWRRISAVFLATFENSAFSATSAVKKCRKK
jgi:hypothetical protein